MPDLSLSFARVKRFFTRRGVLLIVMALAVFMAADMIYDATAPVTPNANAVKVYVFDLAYNAEAFDRLSGRLMDILTSSGVHPDLREIEFECSMFGEDNSNDISMLLIAKLMSGDADLIIANAPATELIEGLEAWMPLDPYLDAGYLAGRDVATRSTVTENGTECIFALSADKLTCLRESGCMFPDGTFVMLAPSSANIEDSLAVLETLFDLSGEAAQ